MAITSRKITAFAKDVSDLPDKTSGAYTAAQAKEQFDAAPNELRVALNNVIDDLGSAVAGDSGAKNIGVTPIVNVTGANVQTVLEDLKLQINGAVTGTIPDGSITQAKLAFTIATNAASVTIADTGAHFTATNVEGALDELFQSASSVKTNVANAIGAPATSSDTGTVLANRITTEKGRLAAEIGDGNSTSTLQYLADRLIVRSDAIATAVNGKGVPATSADTLAQLVTKIGQIATGKQWASGTATFVSGRITVSGLVFTPSVIIANTQIGYGLAWSNFVDGTGYSYYGYPSNVEKGSLTIGGSTGSYVNSTGFSLLTFAGVGGSGKWIAIE